MIGFNNETSGDFFLDVSMGRKPGYSRVNKFGANFSSTAGSTIEVWDGGIAYSYPTTALMTSISQTTDQIAMRGATIELQGLDSNWDRITQTATLDAVDTTTIVTLTTPMIRCFRMKVLANVVSTSTIRCHNDGETVDYAIIDTGNNQTLMAIYTVPAGCTAYMTKRYADVLEDVVSGKDPDATDFVLWASDRANSYEFQVKSSRGVPKGNSGWEHDFKPYYKFTEKTDIRVTALCYARNGNIHSGFDLIVIDN